MIKSVLVILLLAATASALTFYTNVTTWEGDYWGGVNVSTERGGAIVDSNLTNQSGEAELGSATPAGNYNYTYRFSNSEYANIIETPTITETAPLHGHGKVYFKITDLEGNGQAGVYCDIYATAADSDEVMAWYDTLPPASAYANRINTSDYPASNSAGIYTYEFEIRTEDYYYGYDYTLHLICNGEEGLANFTVGLPMRQGPQFYADEGQRDMGYYAGALILFFVVVWLIRYIYQNLRAAWGGRK